MKRIYLFEEGEAKDKRLLGGKGANLAEMTKMGLPVPPGFIITTETCLEYSGAGEKMPEGLMDEVADGITHIEEKTGKKFGDANNPLLVSVRSGAAISMPGMMDTILNLGLNDETAKGLAKLSGNERFAYDAYRRFIAMFCKIAMGVQGELFDETFERIKRKHGAKYDTDLDAEALKEVVEEFKKICKDALGKEFPSDPYEQLRLAIEAVFKSWNSPRCIAYRKEFKITPDIANGTAVNVVAMVFGNMGNDSATGVAFTRDPATGENVLFGEYLTNAQGEDVVAGVRTPKPISKMKDEMPQTYQELLKIRDILEHRYREVQDFEFTIERGKLYILQTRSGKMNAEARVKTAVNMVKEGIITKEDAILRLYPEQLERLMHKRINPKAKAKPIARGLAASPGAASGIAIFSADDAEREGKSGKNVILVREETKPEDVHGFFASQGILTSRGGKTSHAAVVARGIGKPCVSGCEAIRIDVRAKKAYIGEAVIKEGDVLTIDGSSGDVYLGEVSMIEPELGEELLELLKWADEKRRLGVLANTDTPEGALQARKFGAEGIGLCRTERMFNATDRLPLVQEMILCETAKEREPYLEKLLPMQKQDFKEILKAMKGLPVTVRLLDPPLHEFLPSYNTFQRDVDDLKRERDSLSLKRKTPLITKRIKELEKTISEKKKMAKRIRTLAEINPMLGHRGVRVGITEPDIYEAQIRAYFEACAEVMKEGVEIKPELMVPNVCALQELIVVKEIFDRVASEVEQKYGLKVPMKFGTMMEVVRACLEADQIAKVAEFFSFGTNDLTQATFSFSREDAENKFLPFYTENGVLPDNPFQTLDIEGVGKLMKIAVELGRKTRPDLEIGICGEHGGDPRSVEFCDDINLTYVSCSPYRVPIARLAAAQAALRNKSSNLPQTF
jgi:pyruvate,orthophosphate dikinase